MSIQAQRPCPTSARAHAVSAVLLAVPFLGASLAGAQAQVPRVLVSTTSDLAPVAGLPALSDAALIGTGDLKGVAAAFADGHWQGTLGFVPTDVDAIARVPGGAPGAAVSLAFSLLSNEGGVEDGDVVAFAPGGGLVVVVSEVSLLAGLGVPTSDLDVDAAAFDDQGRLVFSLQNDLDGTSLGLVEDGDVLRLETSGGVTRLYTEPEVQTLFTLATGSTGAIGDVNGLEWVQGDPWITTQGPSTWDGAVISIGAAPVVILDENQVGIGGDEIDGLAFERPDDDIASFVLDATSLSEGDSFHVTFAGEPNGVYWALMAGNVGVAGHPAFGGWGELYFDALDPWFQLGLSDLGARTVVLDFTGRLGLDYSLPTAALWGSGFAGEEGWSFQLFEIGSGALSAPYRVVRP